MDNSIGENETQENINEIIAQNEESDLFPGLTKAIQPINNPLNELAFASIAIVYYNVRCGNLRCCLCDCDCKCEKCGCDDWIYKYNTLIESQGVQKYFFRNTAYISSCGVCNDNRFKKCTSNTFSSYKDYAINNGIEFSEMIKSKKNCIICGLCGFYLDIYIKNENRLAGVVKYRGKCEEKLLCADCCKAGCCGSCCHIYCNEILDDKRKTIYYIYADHCCCSCFSIDCCGTINFTIFNKGGKDVGKITCKRDCCPCYGICGFKCQYIIKYPEDCTPELKLTLINSVIAFDLFF